MAQRNPQDSTRRNVQAANKRLAKLEAKIRELVQRMTALERCAPARRR